MRPGQSVGRRQRAVAILLTSLVGIGSVPWRAYAAAPPKPAATKKGGKPGKGEDKDDPKRAEARKSYAEVEAKFQSGDYEGAYAAYKQANDAVPAPQTLYKMALCLDKLGKTSEALAAYNAFLGSSPPSSMDAKVSESQGRVAELKKKAPIVIKVKSEPAGASVTLDGAAQMGTTPLDVKTTPGRHTLKVTSPGYDPYEKELNLEAGAPETTVEATLSKPVVAEAPPPPPPEPKPIEKPVEPTEKRSNTAAYVVLGVAGAGAIVGGIFGVKALQGKSDFDNGERTQDKADSVKQNALIADMALGAAITLGVTGFVLILTNPGTGSDKAASLPSGVAQAGRRGFEFAPVVTPNRAGAVATLRF